MFSPTLINEARVGFSREHTNRLQPNGDDTSDLPGKYGILGVPQVAGNGGLPALRPSNLTQLGHDGWVVSERFSNTLQFSDNLTKVYKSHTFKAGYIYQDIFFGSTQPPYARGEYYWDGRYTSVVNQTDNSTARAQFLLKQIASTVAGGVDFGGGMNDIRVSPFGDVDAFKSYHGAYAQDSWRVTPKLTVNYGVRWDYFSREQEREAEQANMVPGPPATIPDSGRVARQAAVAELPQQPGEGQHSARLHRRIRQRPRPDAEEQLRAAPRRRLSAHEQAGAAGRLRPVLRRVRKPRRQPEPRLQLSVPVHAAVSVAERRAAEPPGGQLARRPDRAPAHRARSGQRERQRPQHARRRVRLQDAAVSQLQRDAAERAGHRITRSKPATSARADATSRRSPG